MEVLIIILRLKKKKNDILFKNNLCIKKVVTMVRNNFGKKDMLSINYFTRNPNPFDWYQNWKSLKDIISQYVKKKHSILNVGCGNSSIFKIISIIGINV